MATRPRIDADIVRPPPTLPPVARGLGLRLTGPQLATIKQGMAVHAASLQPKLTWRGWRQIALACAVGADHIKQIAGGNTRTPSYIRAMHRFLKATGFNHINKSDRAAALRMLPHWDEIDRWRATLPKARQQALNNPREIERAYKTRG